MVIARGLEAALDSSASKRLTVKSHEQDIAVTCMAMEVGGIATDCQR